MIEFLFAMLLLAIVIYVVILVLNMIPIPAPIKTIAYLIVGLLLLVVFLDKTGLYHLSLGSPLK